VTWLNSADAHLQEPADLWLRRLPKHLRDRAPRYEYTDTHRIWIAEGKPFATDPLAEQARADGSVVTDDVELRLRDLDADGVWAETLFGNLGLQCLRFEDSSFAMACARAYNEYLRETFSAYSDRLIPIAVIPIQDIVLAVAEIERVAKLGLRGVSLPMAAHPPYSHEIYDPVWAAAQAHSLPVSFHFGTGLQSHYQDSLAAPNSTVLALGPLRAARVRRTSMPNAMTFLPQQLVSILVGAGVLALHPQLQIVCVEANAGWLAGLMESMDYGWANMMGAEQVDVAALSQQARWPYPNLPSDYVRQQIKVTFQDEVSPLKFMDVTGSEPLLWGSDFPHPEGTWPHSRQITDQLFAGASEAARRAVLGENLAKLYNIAPPSEKWRRAEALEARRRKVLGQVDSS
jgi:predicted TIM-barrel fold metal-dependent hydrolase